MTFGAIARTCATGSGVAVGARLLRRLVASAGDDEERKNGEGDGARHSWAVPDSPCGETRAPLGYRVRARSRKTRSWPTEGSRRVSTKPCFS